jgi:hypothetical protein
LPFGLLGASGEEEAVRAALEAAGLPRGDGVVRIRSTTRTP